MSLTIIRRKDIFYKKGTKEERNQRRKEPKVPIEPPNPMTLVMNKGT